MHANNQIAFPVNVLESQMMQISEDVKDGFERKMDPCPMDLKANLENISQDSTGYQMGKNCNFIAFNIYL